MLRSIPLLLVAAACVAPPEPLMETPVLFRGGADPFAHLADAHVGPEVPVFYATGRRPEGRREWGGGTLGPSYLALEDELLRIGRATVSFDTVAAWDELCALSLTPVRDPEVRLSVAHVEEHAALEVGDSLVEAERLEASHAAFLAALEDRLAHSADPELLVYVHGAKVGFERCSVRTGELVHFAGRDLVPVVFDWPTHPNILAYVLGADHERAHRSARSLRSLLVFLAAHTSARRIHVLCYSAGGIVASEALTALRRGEPELSPDELRAKYRLGTAVFAASDVPLDRFLSEVEDIHAVVQRLTITMSDDDSALALAERVLGGGQRLGSGESLPAEELRALQALHRMELVDVSWGKEARGFDITGHHYWYRHPWVASDVILNLRGDLAASERGLVPTDVPGIWALPPDYPARAQRIAAERLFPARAPAGAAR